MKVYRVEIKADAAGFVLVKAKNEAMARYVAEKALKEGNGSWHMEDAWISGVFKAPGGETHYEAEKYACSLCGEEFGHDEERAGNAVFFCEEEGCGVAYCRNCYDKAFSEGAHVKDTSSEGALFKCPVCRKTGCDLIEAVAEHNRKTAAAATEKASS